MQHMSSARVHQPRCPTPSACRVGCIGVHYRRKGAPAPARVLERVRCERVRCERVRYERVRLGA